MVGCCALSAHKFILYTHYTYTILDISQPLINIDGQAQVKITQDHPGKPLDYNSGWFECLKKSQTSYINQMKGFENEFSRMGVNTPATYVENLTISNSIKGILHMSFDLRKNELCVVEN